MSDSRVRNVLYLKFDGSLLSKRAATASCVLYTKRATSSRLFSLRREKINVKTSGEAEFMGFILAVDTLVTTLPRILPEVGKVDTCRFYGDSQVLFKHLRGTACTRSKGTERLSTVASRGIAVLKEIGINPEMYWVPRKCNLLADTLCKTAYCFTKEPYQLPWWSNTNTETSKRLTTIGAALC